MRKLIIFLALVGLLIAALLSGCTTKPAATATKPPVNLLAYINVTSGCQKTTVDFLKELKRKYAPRVALEIVDFGDGGAGALRWQNSGYSCMTIAINGSPYVKFKSGGVMHTVAFTMPAGFLWTHKELEAAVKAALAGKLQHTTKEQAEGAEPASPVEVKVSVEDVDINGKPAGAVMMNGEKAFVVVAAADGETARQRAETAAKAMQQWLAGPFKPSDLSMHQVNKGWAAMLGSTQLLVATHADAGIVGATPRSVAAAWLLGVKHALIATTRPSPS